MERREQYENQLINVEQASSEVMIHETNNINTRTSGLQAPTVMLTGHEAAIFSLSFDPAGKNLASASMDRNIFLWEVYGESKNYNVLTGHKNAVLEVHWLNTLNGSQILSCSADKTVGLWDANKGVRTRRLTDHTGIVNSCSAASEISSIFASGSDDCTAIVWDARDKKSVLSMFHDYQVTSVCITSDGSNVYTGGIDNIIRRWNLRNSAEPIESLKLLGHNDTITGLSISPDGNHLLSNSMDSTVRCWDIRPFVEDENNRFELNYEGTHHGAEKNLLRCSWSTNGDMIACGSADRIVRLYDSNSAKMLYCLGGHKGSVNEVIFHPSEPIIASCGSDKVIYLGELM